MSEIPGIVLKRDDHMPLLTRKALWPALRAAGFPIADSTGTKLCAPSVNQGPPIEAWWGRQPLHDLDKGIAWAQSRLPGVPRREPSNTKLIA
jgi:hypothetical protein